MKFKLVLMSCVLALTTFSVNARGGIGGGGRGGGFGGGFSRSVSPPSGLSSGRALPAAPAAIPAKAPAPPIAPAPAITPQRSGIGSVTPQPGAGSPPAPVAPVAQKSGIGSVPPQPSPTKPPIAPVTASTQPTQAVTGGSNYSGAGNYTAPQVTGGGLNAWHVGAAAIAGAAIGYGLGNSGDDSVSSPPFAQPSAYYTPTQVQPPVAQSAVYSSYAAQQQVQQPVPAAAPEPVVAQYNPIQPVPQQISFNQKETSIMSTILSIILIGLAGLIAYIVKKHYDAWKKSNTGDFNVFYNQNIGKLFDPKYIPSTSGQILTGAYAQSVDDSRKFIDIFIKIQQAYWNNTSLSNLLTEGYRRHVQENYVQPTGKMPNYLDQGINCLINDQGTTVWVTYFYHDGAEFIIEQFKYLNYGGKYYLDQVV